MYRSIQIVSKFENKIQRLLIYVLSIYIQYATWFKGKFP